MPPLSWRTSVNPCARMNALAFSQRMPPVQYMMRGLSFGMWSFLAAAGNSLKV